MEYTIERNVPIPPLPQGRKPKYPWDEMEVGDSFVISNGKASVVSSANKRYKRKGKKFTARRMNEGDLRIWRLK